MIGHVSEPLFAFAHSCFPGPFFSDTANLDNRAYGLAIVVAYRTCGKCNRIKGTVLMHKGFLTLHPITLGKRSVDRAIF